MNLVAFYQCQTPDNLGRRLSDYWTWNHDRLEEVHNFIQWMFPLMEPSNFNASAPTLDAQSMAEFRNQPAIQQNLLKSLEVMLDFYGFTLDRVGKSVTPAAHFHERADNWLFPNDHNHLRITRILKCLTLCGLGDYATAFHAALLHVSTPTNVTTATLRFWNDAVR
ncbi:MAG TPA: opioid growth factor receptor-related protein [Gemmataceae bacterium]|nr:opioid growth factor receptor-related protein [Gemmataceae bacterium]